MELFSTIQGPTAKRITYNQILILGGVGVVVPNVKADLEGVGPDAENLVVQEVNEEGERAEAVAEGARARKTRSSPIYFTETLSLYLNYVNP